MPTLLIDGDELVYKCTSAVELEVRWDDTNHVMYSDESEAWQLIQKRLRDLSRELGANERIICFSGYGNFRKQLYPQYKSHRKGLRKPMCYGAMVERLALTDNSVSFENCEADDVMGILSTSGDYLRPIIVSDDKDMLTIPGFIYRNGQTTYVSPEHADINWLRQTLVGDVADGYPGCPGVGSVTAEKLLPYDLRDNGVPMDELWYAIVVSEFERKGLTEADALMQARMARILRADGWDQEKSEVKLWNPR